MKNLEVYSRRWKPFGEMEELQNRLNTLFGVPSLRRGGKNEAFTRAAWMPLVDITEDEKEYVVKAELSELDKDAIKVKVERGVLTISGERKCEEETTDRKYHLVERSYGAFTRSFSVPEDAAEAEVSAEFREGVLRVHLPKSEKSKPKTIDVRVD